MAVRIIRATRPMVPGQGGETERRLKVAAYARVSTDSDEQESSYEAQCEHYTEYISGHPEWEFAGIFADAGITGTMAKKRPEFLRMIAECEAGNIDLVLTKSISRFARNTLDCLQYIRRLKALGIAIYFEKENINTLDAKGEVLITILASIAQQESLSISQNVRMGIQYRMQQGKGRVNTAASLGYTKGDAPDALVIVPEEAEIVRRIFRQFLEGYSPAMICRRLEADGIRTGKGGERWYASTVTNMLENEKYAGAMLLQKYYTVDYLTHKVAKNRGQLPQYYVEKHHAPIVPPEVYFQVQGELMRRSALRQDPTKLRYGSTMALSGRLICGRCGRTLKRFVKPDGMRTDWRCRDRAYVKDGEMRDVRSVCGCRFVRETDVKRAVVEAFDRLPARRDELLIARGRLLSGDLQRIDVLLAQNRKAEEQLETRREALTQEGPEGAGEELLFVERQIGELRAERDGLTRERAESARREVLIRFLLELVDDMKAKNEAYIAARLEGHPPEMPETDRAAGPAEAACGDYEEFFRRTRTPLGDALDDQGKLAAFDDGLVIRYVESITVQDDGYEVAFKAGLCVKVS